MCSRSMQISFSLLQSALCFLGQQNVSSNKLRLFPNEEFLQEGSSFFFCCIPPDGARVTALSFSNMPYPLINISHRVQAIRVLGLNTTKMVVNLICQDDSGNQQAVLNYVTCEFSWKQGADINLSTLSMLGKGKKLKC